MLCYQKGLSEHMRSKREPVGAAVLDVVERKPQAGLSSLFTLVQQAVANVAIARQLRRIFSAMFNLPFRISLRPGQRTAVNAILFILANLLLWVLVWVIQRGNVWRDTTIMGQPVASLSGFNSFLRKTKVGSDSMFTSSFLDAFRTSLNLASFTPAFPSSAVFPPSHKNPENRFAIVIAGGSRTFYECFPSIYRTFIAPNSENVDVFFLLNLPEKRTLLDMYQFKLLVPEPAPNNWLKMVVLGQASLDEVFEKTAKGAKAAGTDPPKVECDNLPFFPRQIASLKSISFSFQQCKKRWLMPWYLKESAFELVRLYARTHGISYKLGVYIRPDSYFLDTARFINLSFVSEKVERLEAPDETDEENEDAEPQLYYLTSRNNDWGGINDRFGIASWESLSKGGLLRMWRKSWVHCPVPNSETALLQELRELGITKIHVEDLYDGFNEAGKMEEARMAGGPSFDYKGPLELSVGRRRNSPAEPLFDGLQNASRLRGRGQLLYCQMRLNNRHLCELPGLGNPHVRLYSDMPYEHFQEEPIESTE